MTTTTEDLSPKLREALELTNDPEVGLDTHKLAERLGITRNAAAGHIRKLRESGHLPPSTRKPRRRRAAPASTAAPDTMNGDGDQPSAADRLRERVRQDNIIQRDAARAKAEAAAKESAAYHSVADELEAAISAMDEAHRALEPA